MISRTITITVIAISTVVGLGVGSVVAKNIFSNGPDTVSAITNNLPVAAWATPLPSPTPSPAIATPKALQIPKLNITTTIEHVGEDSQGRMDVPKAPDNVAWYNLGAKPGERGRAVLAGHLDSATGPAVFANLDQLRPGDEIVVSDEAGQQYTFKVTRQARYAFDAFPLNEVFGKSTHTELNLITCAGQFDGSTKNYSHRVVVYAELVPTNS